MNETIDLLKRRRSAPPQTMSAPGPSAAELETLLGIASRVPDHGKLTPWRFIVFEGDARDKAGTIAASLLQADDPAIGQDRLRVERERFSRAPLVVGVVSRAAQHFKIPEWEQLMSAGAACMNLVVAANAMGFRTAWLTEWCAYDRRFCEAIGLSPSEKIAGFVYIGRPTVTIEDRPRPLLADIVTQFEG